METRQSLRRNFLWNTAGSLIYFACQWLFTILAVRLAGVYVSGLLMMALTVTNVFLSIASYGMYNYQVSDTAQKYAQSTYIHSRIITCSLATFACICYIILVLIVKKTPYGAEQILCIFLVLGYRLIESVTDVYNAIDQKHGRLDIVGKTYAARGVLSLALFAVTLRITTNLPITLVLMLLGNLAFFVLYTKPQAKQFYEKSKTEWRTIFALLVECAPLAIYCFLNTSAASIPKIMLELVLGNDALGIYGPVTAPVLLLQVGATYLFTPFITIFSDKYAQRDKKGFARAIGSVLAIILVLLPIGLLISHFLGAWGLATFVSEGLVEYSYLLAPMVFSAVLTALVLFFSMVLTIMRCMRGLIFANVCGIVVALLCSVKCIETWGMQGTTYAAILALLAQTVCLVCVMFQQAKQYFSTENMS
ncbi:MAG: lipopolysaccharide biosynthesis protein [Ruthenibacterium sp.]